MLREFNFIYKYYKMILPFNELRFNIAFWVLITLYWFSGLWDFFAYMPKWQDSDDDIFHFNHCSYSFRLITSLIFFLIWVSQFKYEPLVFLTVAEIFLVIIIYIRLIISKQKYIKTQKKKLASVHKKRMEEMKERLS